MILVSKFGDWGASINGGWIDYRATKNAANFLFKLFESYIDKNLFIKVNDRWLKIMYDVDFGNCCECGTLLNADWFKDIEFEPKSNILIGRVRWAVNYLYCPNCFKKFSVDDSFDEKWFYGEKRRSIK